MKTWALIFLFPLFLGGGIFTALFFWSDVDVKNAVYNISTAVEVFDAGRDYYETHDIDSFKNIEYDPDRYSQQVAIKERIDYAVEYTEKVLVILCPVLILWVLIAFSFQKELIFAFSGARPITRQENPEIYNIVENLCISRGLAVPKIWIIDHYWMNAFALGWTPSNSRIVFTKGVLEKLNRNEVEAVAAHELTHIMNKDSLLMFVMIIYIWGISMIGEILIRTGRGKWNEKGKSILPLIWLVLIVLGYLFYPLIRLAISRKREFLADAGAVELTKDNQAMISALQKISKDSLIPLKNEKMAAMFIENPLDTISELFQTHPSIQERIAALKNY